MLLVLNGIFTPPFLAVNLRLHVYGSVLLSVDLKFTGALTGNKLML